MNCITNEIERSQRGGALNAGCGAAPEYLPELKDNISAAREIAREYCNLTITNKKNRNYIVCYFVHLIIGANKLLPIYINELRKGLRMEAFPISSEMHGDDVFWKWCDTVCRDMERHKVYHYLKESIDKLKALLADAEKAMMHCDPTLFERFFYREEQHYNSSRVKRRFDMWLYDDSYPDIDKLRELQAQVVAETLKMGVMDFAKMPSQKEIDEVKLDYLTSLLPCDFEVDENFKIACAQWRRFMHWEGTILVIDYKKYGKYIQAHFYEFSDKQLQAIFELDMMLKLIHQEMARIKPKPEVKHTDSRKPDEELFKFIHPSICGEEVWLIHDEVKRLLSNHGIPEICDYLYQMSRDGRILLPKMPSVAYAEMVRMGMPTGKGYSEKYFNKFYRK